jgi:hypothetical protein
MKKLQVDHVLRAAGRMTGEKEFVIVGSQALHGAHPDLADQIIRSAEVDLIAEAHVDRTEWLNVIGQDSPFHNTFGYYADPVDNRTAVLPTGWEQRLVTLAAGDTDGVRARCLDPNDLAISKYVAGRQKDRIFTRELARRAITSREKLLELLVRTPIAGELADLLRPVIIADFASTPVSRPD